MAGPLGHPVTLPHIQRHQGEDVLQGILQKHQSADSEESESLQAVHPPECVVLALLTALCSRVNCCQFVELVNKGGDRKSQQGRDGETHPGSGHRDPASCALLLRHHQDTGRQGGLNISIILRNIIIITTIIIIVVVVIIILLNRCDGW